MSMYQNKDYLSDIKYVSNLSLPWNLINDKSILISGATGLLGSFLVDVILFRNSEYKMNTHIYALGRSKEHFDSRFAYYNNSDLLTFIKCDVQDPKAVHDLPLENINYVIHLASNTHPYQYATDPIGTIITNIIGLKNLLDFSSERNVTRFAFASSNEIYGENRGDVEFFSEDYCGYIDSNTLRAGYPESKRCGEALCQAFIAQKELDIVIPRITRSYGPTLLKSDTKALSQFLNNGLNGEDIVLKSEGSQYYSYLYVADTVSGLLTVLLCGENGEAYNIADEQSDITLKELAEVIADFCDTKVVFELPDSIESKGYSKATKARLKSDKLKDLGWHAKYDIKTGIKRTIEILRDS